MERILASWRTGYSSYLQRVASRQQPNFSQWPQYPWLDFLDNRNWNAVVMVAVVYVLAVGLVYRWSAARAQPFKLTRCLQVYNVACVLLAGYVVYGVVVYKLEKPGSFVCNGMDLDTDQGRKLAFVIWVYYAQKFLELLDTFLFILRQSWRQVTFLHVYHHASILVVTGAFLCFDVNGDCAVTAAPINAFVHVLMYSHYFLSSLGVKAWWKAHLTKLQMIQFVVCLLQPVYAFYVGPDCGYPDFLKVGMVLYQSTMLLLFGAFYSRAYKERKDPPSQDSSSNAKPKRTKKEL